MNWKIVAAIVGGSALVLAVGVGMGTRNAPNVSNAPNIASLEMTNKDWVRGKGEVTIVEYGDFQCPACAAYYPLTERLLTEFAGKVRLSWRHFPLVAIHDKAMLSATAAEAAGAQGKFWQMYAKLFESQEEWSKSSQAREVISGYAKDIGLDLEKFSSDWDKSADRVYADLKSGQDLKVNGTPTFFVNGVKIDLPGSYENFKKIIEGEAAKVTPAAEAVHWHFDIAIYVDGKKIDLAEDKYMERNPMIHLHDNNGEVVHIHQKGATLGTFIDSLGLSPEAGPKVNGEVVKDWRSYQPQDLDRIVFGQGAATDKACIYSERCPERGKPLAENCVGGLDTPCE